MRTIRKFMLQGEVMKIKQLNEKEVEAAGYNFCVTRGDYDDIEFECDSLKECEENIASY